MRAKVFDIYVWKMKCVHQNLKPSSTMLRNGCLFSPQGNVDCCKAIEDQYESLNNSNKRLLVLTLTHKNGELNIQVLDTLPFLRRRCAQLLEKPVRSERSDKIDLTSISDFIHDYCRYVYLCILTCISLNTLCDMM